MFLFESIVLSFVLSLDCFAISISQALNPHNNKKSIIILSILFGGFQALMFLAGFYTGSYFLQMFNQFSKYISAALLIFISVKMIKEGLEKSEEAMDFNNFKDYLFLSFATSIDAFAAGISYNTIKANFLFTFFLVGLISFIMSLIGGFAGKQIGKLFGRYSEIFGGIILAILAIKTFFD